MQQQQNSRNNSCTINFEFQTAQLSILQHNIWTFEQLNPQLQQNQQQNKNPQSLSDWLNLQCQSYNQKNQSTQDESSNQLIQHQQKKFIDYLLNDTFNFSVKENLKQAKKSQNRDKFKKKNIQDTFINNSQKVPKVWEQDSQNIQRLGILNSKIQNSHSLQIINSIQTSKSKPKSQISISQELLKFHQHYSFSKLNLQNISSICMQDCTVNINQLKFQSFIQRQQDGYLLEPQINDEQTTENMAQIINGWIHSLMNSDFNKFQRLVYFERVRLGYLRNQRNLQKKYNYNIKMHPDVTLWVYKALQSIQQELSISQEYLTQPRKYQLKNELEWYYKKQIALDPLIRFNQLSQIQGKQGISNFIGNSKQQLIEGLIEDLDICNPDRLDVLSFFLQTYSQSMKNKIIFQSYKTIQESDYQDYGLQKNQKDLSIHFNQYYKLNNGIFRCLFQYYEEDKQHLFDLSSIKSDGFNRLVELNLSYLGISNINLSKVIQIRQKCKDLRILHLNNNHILTISDNLLIRLSTLELEENNILLIQNFKQLNFRALSQKPLLKILNLKDNNLCDLSIQKMIDFIKILKQKGCQMKVFSQKIKFKVSNISLSNTLYPRFQGQIKPIKVKIIFQTYWNHQIIRQISPSIRPIRAQREKQFDHKFLKSIFHKEQIKINPHKDKLSKQEQYNFAIFKQFMLQPSKQIGINPYKDKFHQGFMQHRVFDKFDHKRHLANKQNFRKHIWQPNYKGIIKKS